MCTSQPPFEEDDDTTIPIDFEEKLLEYKHHCDDETFKQLLDFLARLLTVDPETRISATEALKHPYL